MRGGQLPWWFCLAGLAACTAGSGAPRVERSGPGFVYFKDDRPRQHLRIHFIRVDRSEKALALHATLGNGSTFGMATVAQQVRTLPPEIGQPIAAISGDYNDETAMEGPLGLQIERRELIRAPASGRASFYVDASGDPHLAVVESRVEVTWPDGTTERVRLNLPGKNNGAALFSHAADRGGGGPAGLEIILGRHGKDPWLPLQMGRELTGVIFTASTGGSRRRRDQLVLSISPESASFARSFKLGQTMKIATHSKPDLTGATTGIGSGPALVLQGKPRHFNSPVRHPRAAIGWNAQYFFMVAVDGRSVRTSMGMTLTELARYLADLGCDYAMNLDGGASTALWLLGEIVNRPSERRGERPVPNALVLVRRP